MKEQQKETGSKREPTPAESQRDAAGRPEVDLRNPYVAGLLNWLAPGLGHVYQRRYFKAAVFGFSVWILALAGIAMGSYWVDSPDGSSRRLYLARNVYCSWRSGDARLAFIPQMGVGLYAIPAIVQYKVAKDANLSDTEVDESDYSLYSTAFAPPQLPSEIRSRPNQPTADEIAARLNSWLDVGLLYTMTAGMLNFFAIFDALGGPSLFEFSDEKEEKKKKKDKTDEQDESAKDDE